MNNLRFFYRRALALVLNPFHRDYSHCHRCGLNWHSTTGHTTIFRRDETGGHGMFPLCHSCWQECSVEQRLPYYHDLWLRFGEDDDISWSEIEQAVRQEQQC